MGRKTKPFKSVEGVHWCITSRGASVVKRLISMRKVVHAGNVVMLDEKNLHIRNNRDGTVIKPDVNNGVYTMGMWVCPRRNGSSFQLARTVSGSSATKQTCKTKDEVQQ